MKNGNSSTINATDYINEDDEEEDVNAVRFQNNSRGNNNSVAITTTEEIEVELTTPIQTLTEEGNKPHNTGATQAGEESQTEVIEEAALSNTHKPKTT